jgi:hypothetical protein
VVRAAEKSTTFATKTMLQLRFLFWISEIVVVLLMIIPIARFLLY